MSLIPVRTASSTTYWIAGLSTTGSISFGCAFVAGRNLVPSPAAGMTPLVTFTEDLLSGAWSLPTHIGRTEDQPVEWDSTRSRPAALARYIAWSAARTTVSAVIPSSG